MTEVELDFGTVKPQTYSTNSERLAQRVLEIEGVTPLSHRPGYWVRSLRGDRIYEVTPHFDAEGGVAGLRCDCPNGRLGGVQPRCYHALAVELYLEEAVNASQDRKKMEDHDED